MRHHEHHEQVILVQWLRRTGILFAAIPNGARTSLSVAKRLKAEGLSAGMPDLLIFDVPEGKTFIGVAIELKRADGKGRASPEQMEWLAQLSARGWCALVCHGAADALMRLSELGYRVPGSSLRSVQDRNL